MKGMLLQTEDWLEMMSDLAVILADEYGDGLDVVVDENGDEYYTDESQERFNSYTDEAENIMVRLRILPANWEKS
jgi:hypothetical protein|tara:strand:- start:1099 stop:1323 length:225 start_codon:yes stop_codon:yes gene_type:complete